MTTEKNFKEHWNVIKGQIHQKWNRVPESALTKTQGNFTQVVNLISQTYNQPQSQVTQELERITNTVTSSTATAGSTHSPNNSGSPSHR